MCTIDKFSHVYTSVTISGLGIDTLSSEEFLVSLVVLNLLFPSSFPQSNLLMCFLSLYFHFLDFHIIGIVQYVIFSLVLLPLNINKIHLHCSMCPQLFLFIAEYCFILRIWYYLLFYLLMNFYMIFFGHMLSFLLGISSCKFNDWIIRQGTIQL